MQKDRSKDLNENEIGEIQADSFDEEKHSHEAVRYDPKQQISLAEVGVQTSRDNEKPNLSKTVNHERKDSIEKEDRSNNSEEKSIITKLKRQLEEAQAKITQMENEQFEAEKRRAIEFSTKYVPTSFKRYQIYSYIAIVHMHINNIF